jgi:UDP-N-acetylmuramate--alanine ligase
MKDKKHIHFIGIGGTGMSGIAKILLSLNYQVSGSDLKYSYVMRRLKKLGATVYIGHRKENITSPELVVVSSAISPDNPEILAAKEKNIPVIQRAEMLQMLMEKKFGIAIAGTHGKTTTTSMIALVLEKNGYDPTIVVGGELNDIGGNAKLGKSKYIVVEADESDNSFLKLFPKAVVITNIERDHLEYHKNLKNIISSFEEFVKKVSNSGFAVLCKDHPNVRKILPEKNIKYITYGIKTDSDFKARNILQKEDRIYFEVFYKDKKLGDVTLKIPGIHNVLNALACIGCASEIGIPFEEISSTLTSFSGVRRRFQIIGNVEEITIIDDYAHHPTEIDATLLAAKEIYNGRRIICIFQPHRYTRTKLLLKEFANSFKYADIVIITDIYSAMEPAIPDVEAKQIVDLMKKNNRKVKYIGDTSEIVKEVLKISRKRDIIITMGAGDIYKVGKKLLYEFKKRKIIPKIIIN